VEGCLIRHSSSDTSRLAEGEDLPPEIQNRLPRYPVPVVHLALTVSARVGVYAVEVEAKNDAARVFSSKFGFLGLPEDPLRMYLSMNVIRKLPW